MVFFRKHKWWAIVLGLAGAAAAISGGIWAFALRNRTASNNPELITPVLAVRAIAPRSLFFTRAAWPCLAALQPELLVAEDKDSGSERSRQFAAALQYPGVWRRLDRQYHFDTVLLTGEPAQFRPLLKHLLESSEWVLAYLDHTSIVFQLTPARPWTGHDLDRVRQKFDDRPSRERVEFLVQASTRLLAAREALLAGQYADKALALDDDSAPAWTQRAACDGMGGKWPEALTAAERAVQIDKAFAPGLSMQAQALLAMGRAGEAYDISRELVEMNPRDPFLLFQHARISHAAHAYESESEVLKTLISMAETARQPACGYRIYLAQAYAASGEADLSLDAFHKALDDPDISPEERAYVQESIQKINSKIGR